jgi:hypothetical protein
VPSPPRQYAIQYSFHSFHHPSFSSLIFYAVAPSASFISRHHFSANPPLPAPVTRPSAYLPCYLVYSLSHFTTQVPAAGVQHPACVLLFIPPPRLRCSCSTTPSTYSSCASTARHIAPIYSPRSHSAPSHPSSSHHAAHCITSRPIPSTPRSPTHFTQRKRTSRYPPLVPYPQRRIQFRY